MSPQVLQLVAFAMSPRTTVELQLDNWVVFDCRHLSRIPKNMQNLPGNHSGIITLMQKSPKFQMLWDEIKRVIPQQDTHLEIKLAFGCHNGYQKSVAMRTLTEYLLDEMDIPYDTRDNFATQKKAARAPSGNTRGDTQNQKTPHDQFIEEEANGMRLPGVSSMFIDAFATCAAEFLMTSEENTEIDKRFEAVNNMISVMAESIVSSYIEK